MAERIYFDPGFPYTELRDGIARLCLPIEDFANGLYIHPESVTVVAVTSTLSSRDAEMVEEVGHDSGPSTGYYVLALDFMEIQRERDKYRRALSLLNADVQTDPPHIPRDPRERMVAVLQEAGFTALDAEATRRLIAWASEGGERQKPRGGVHGD